MRNFLIALLIFCIWTFFGLWLYTILRSDNTAQAGVTLPNVEQTGIPGNTEAGDTTADNSTGEGEVVAADQMWLSATTPGGDLVFRYDEGVPIRKNDPQVSIPTSIINFKYQLNTYLLEHPQEELLIISRYGADEQIESPNLGQQRGESLRRLLLETGLPDERISVEAEIGPLAFDGQGRLSNGFRFVFRPVER